jgi:uncharacterized membrane protein
MSEVAVNDPSHRGEIALHRLALWISRHWLGLFIFAYGIFVLTPFLAPILMRLGATTPADGIYWLYSLVCHQLPQRSIFLFGAKPMYSLSEIKAVWPEDGFAELRQFIGNAQMGYKMAWSDRMISFYGSLWVGALLYAVVRDRLPPLPAVLWFLLGVVPVGVDGVTHMINDLLAGTSGTGFRDTNAWLESLTGSKFPSWFYVGDAFGSFNSDLRWITGVLFGLLTVWFIFPVFERAMRDPNVTAAAEPVDTRRQE